LQVDPDSPPGFGSAFLLDVGRYGFQWFVMVGLGVLYLALEVGATETAFIACVDRMISCSTFSRCLDALQV
jgi:hypothetical protein